MGGGGGGRVKCKTGGGSLKRFFLKQSTPIISFLYELSCPTEKTVLRA